MSKVDYFFTLLILIVIFMLVRINAQEFDFKNEANLTDGEFYVQEMFDVLNVDDLYPLVDELDSLRLSIRYSDGCSHLRLPSRLGGIQDAANVRCGKYQNQESCNGCIHRP